MNCPVRHVSSWIAAFAIGVPRVSHPSVSMETPPRRNPMAPSKREKVDTKSTTQHGHFVTTCTVLALDFS